jgi:hypothetical protein
MDVTILRIVAGTLSVVLLSVIVYRRKLKTTV